MLGIAKVRRAKSIELKSAHHILPEEYLAYYKPKAKIKHSLTAPFNPVYPSVQYSLSIKRITLGLGLLTFEITPSCYNYLVEKTTHTYHFWTRMSRFLDILSKFQRAKTLIESEILKTGHAYFEWLNRKLQLATIIPAH